MLGAGRWPRERVVGWLIGGVYVLVTGSALLVSSLEPYFLEILLVSIVTAHLAKAVARGWRPIWVSRDRRRLWWIETRHELRQWR